MESLGKKASSLVKQAESLVRDIESRSLNKVYIAGPMSGLPDFNRTSFFSLGNRIKHLGYVVLNPAVLPDGLTQAEYMDICCAMVRAADCVVMLEGWEDSDGAVAEYHLAKKLGKALMTELDVGRHERILSCEVSYKAFG
ncbi:DUF4406 domain-containing protein [Vibrio minamisatsumaniensis]|uniref:DUF4406 domain-containing protein n=1 Tax=Vibrio minamisatsumaniensis TaxID=2910243 RepID=UPI003D2608C8